MHSVIIGVLMITVALVVLIARLPRDGKVVSSETFPFLDAVIPIAITSGIALGSAMIAAGILL